MGKTSNREPEVPPEFQKFLLKERLVTGKLALTQKVAASAQKPS